MVVAAAGRSHDCCSYIIRQIEDGTHQRTNPSRARSSVVDGRSSGSDVQETTIAQSTPWRAAGRHTDGTERHRAIPALDYNDGV